MKKIILSFIACLLVSAQASAQTQFIKYKKYLIPIQSSQYNECDAESKPKVIVSSDIAGFGEGDDDDIQSLIHYLSVSDRLDTLGFVSSPPGIGRADDYLTVINEYAKDYPELSAGNPGYPSPSYFVVQQGLLSVPSAASGVANFNANTPDHAGAKFIKEKAEDILNRSECGPLYVLVWGSISDVALALKANPEIAKVLRVYFIASSNKNTDLVSYNYVASNFLSNDSLWFIESDTTFRGINVPPGPNLAAQGQAKAGLQVYGCLGRHLSFTRTDYQGGDRPNPQIPSGNLPNSLKIGDTPSVTYLLNGDRNAPQSPSWGGSYDLVSNKTQYWTDKPNRLDALNTVASFVGSLGSPNTIYNDWFQSMSRIGFGCTSN